MLREKEKLLNMRLAAMHYQASNSSLNEYHDFSQEYNRPGARPYSAICNNTSYTNVNSNIRHSMITNKFQLNQGLSREATPYFPNYQSSQTLSVPKFQLLYHVQPHLQQFQQKVLIKNLNSSITNAETNATSLTDDKTRKTYSTLSVHNSACLKKDFLMPSFAHKNVSSYQLYQLDCIF